MKYALPLLVPFIAMPALANETRQLGAHVHGVSTLNIAIDGDTIVLELHAPGFDIVGFEHTATSIEDRAAIAEALAKLARPSDVFSLPAAADCLLVTTSAELENEDDDDHTDDDGHDHEEHAEGGDDDHDHEAHADGDDHDEDEAESHTEFHAEYELECGVISAATEITIGFFDAFPNGVELEVQVVSDDGAQAFELDRDTTTLDISAFITE